MLRYQKTFGSKNQKVLGTKIVGAIYDNILSHLKTFMILKSSAPVNI